ncbi:hypothetical protein [Kribbella sp.]|uniref:hypothetical protein n=1 Tax=Kribbella sp. TaxID=1871183 RepID=UPI002D268F05|nr:hypothetical protein [Kribbella sp.]HZX03644.1 hypothetical protein [Kribbella sp.]
MEDTRPRRIPRLTRLGLSVGLVLVVAAALALLAGAVGRSWLTSVALAIAVVGLIVIAQVIGNLGTNPQINGHYLEARTLIGRQSVDLARLTGVRWDRSRGGTVWVSVQDDVTDLAISIPVPSAVDPVLTDALRDAVARGVRLRRRVTDQFGLPPVPGAPRNGGSKLTILAEVVVALVAFAVVLGLIISF